MSHEWWQAPVKALNQEAAEAARARQQVLTKPAGSLGELEMLAIRLAGMQGQVCPDLKQPWISIFAGDHGVAAAGVSAFPPEVTAQMVANFSHGGAAICVLARQIQAEFEVVDAGVSSDTSHLPGVVQAKVMAGTANFLEQPAMTAEQCMAALNVGRAAVERALAAGADCFIAGEMGIGNTTSATALACVWIYCLPGELAGPGTGLNPAGVSRKAFLISVALQKHAARLDSPLAVLATLGGCEIAAMAGAYLAAAQAGLPALVDGFISSVAALAACQLNPGVKDWLLFGHQSAEHAHARVLAALGGQPLIRLNLRLGEGSGAATAYPLLKIACALHGQMATFAEAGVNAGE